MLQVVLVVLIESAAFLFSKPLLLRPANCARSLTGLLWSVRLFFFLVLFIVANRRAHAVKVVPFAASGSPPGQRADRLALSMTGGRQKASTFRKSKVPLVEGHKGFRTNH